MEKELINYWPSLEEHDDLLKECVTLCECYALTPEDLWYKWEALVMKLEQQGEEISLDRVHFMSLKRQVEESFEKKHKDTRSTKPTYAIKGEPNYSNNFTSDNLDDFLAVIAPSTPSRNRSYLRNTDVHTPSPTRIKKLNYGSPVAPSPQTQRFAERSNRARIEDIYNPHLKSYVSPEGMVSSRRRFEFQEKDEKEVREYRYMFEKISEKSKVLDDRIENFADIFRETYNWEILSNPAQSTQSSVVTGGRVCSDSEAKINDKSILLEPSRIIGSGLRVQLDLNEIPSFAMFPGLIIGVEGLNNTGASFTASKVFQAPVPPRSMTPVSQLLFNNYDDSRLGGRPLGMVVASGPYRLDDNLDFVPFAELLATIGKEKPDILLLVGPFVDQDHPLIREGDFDGTVEEIFDEYIAQPLRDLENSSPSTSVFLIPSIRDIVHDYYIFPQPALDSYEFRLPKNVQTLSNPAQFTINEIHFAISSHDILFHLSGDEIGRNPAFKDRMGRLARHVLEQRN
ncbi:DNA-directed DNA polymerase alpha subunit pol12 [Basidiobolus ranarum]|uniref:DNA polymerase alpha subunit B n=1 Tax=Basidiobolus ranarum TaxID=34480 RepID=A0ABR2VS64_9FUNG